MYCISCCTAANYQLNDISNFLKKQGYLIKPYRNTALQAYKKNESTILFVFAHGSFVLWSESPDADKIILELLAPFTANPLSHIERNQFLVHRGEKTEILVHKKTDSDVIMLDTDDDQVKLALSYGFAQSIKLESYETLLQKTIDKNAYLAEVLAKQGRIPLSKKTMLRKTGEIFVARSFINLNSEYLDVPEYFWEHASIENYYTMCEKFFDIHRRVITLNQKLDVLQELFDILNNQLQHRHSAFLEMTIIVLIAVEIVLTLVYTHFRI